MNELPTDKSCQQQSQKPLRVADLLVPFLYPTLMGKCFILYFGLNYSESPGDGYGIGLVIAILFTVVMIGRFLWRYRNYEEETP